jgi:hypothetical protein
MDPATSCKSFDHMTSAPSDILSILLNTPNVTWGDGLSIPSRRRYALDFNPAHQRARLMRSRLNKHQGSSHADFFSFEGRS